MTWGHQSVRQRAVAICRQWGVDRAFAILATAATILLFVFIRIAGEVWEGETRALDQAILLTFRTQGDLSRPIGPEWLQELVRDITALGSPGVLAIISLAVVGWLLFSGKRGMAVFVLVSVAGGGAFSSLLKFGFARPRPDLFPPATTVFTSSFPSGHAMLSALVYLTIGNLVASSQTSVSMKIYTMSLALTVTVLVGLSRIYLGVHWPSDVMAGWAVGACWALLCWLVMSRLGVQARTDMCR